MSIASIPTRVGTGIAILQYCNICTCTCTTWTSTPVRTRVYSSSTRVRTHCNTYRYYGHIPVLCNIHVYVHMQVRTRVRTRVHTYMCTYSVRMGHMAILHFIDVHIMSNCSTYRYRYLEAANPMEMRAVPGFSRQSVKRCLGFHLDGLAVLYSHFLRV